MIKAEGGHWVMTDDERRQLVGAVGRWRQLAVEMMEAFGHDPGDPADRGAAAIASEAERLPRAAPPRRVRRAPAE